MRVVDQKNVFGSVGLFYRESGTQIEDPMRRSQLISSKVVNFCASKRTTCFFLSGRVLPKKSNNFDCYLTKNGFGLLSKCVFQELVSSTRRGLI